MRASSSEPIIIQVDITKIDPRTQLVHMESHEWVLDDGETFTGIACITTTEPDTTKDRIKKKC